MARDLPVCLTNVHAWATISQLLLDLAASAGLSDKITAMFGGQPINATEGRAVMHVALRARRDQVSVLLGHGN